MRYSNKRKRVQPSTDDDSAVGIQPGTESRSLEINDNETIADISLQAVGKLLRRAKSCGGTSSLKKKSSVESLCMPGGAVKRDEKRVPRHASEASSSANAARENIQMTGLAVGKLGHSVSDNKEDLDDTEWEVGSIPMMDSTCHLTEDNTDGMTIELSGSPDSPKRKPIRRFSAEEKELAELVHKAHLLCLVARGRLIDNACDDPLIQAALLSLLPQHLLKLSEVPELTANVLSPLVDWFHNNFNVRSPTDTRKSFRSALAHSLETHEGTCEEVTGLFVALCRALNLATRFVSILDVSSLRPDAERYESCNHNASSGRKGIFDNSTLMVNRQKQVSGSWARSGKMKACETSSRGSCRSMDGCSSGSNSQLRTSVVADGQQERLSDSSDYEAQHDISDVTKSSQVPKRKGDIEFERQLEMALSATAAGVGESKVQSDIKDTNDNFSNISSSSKNSKRLVKETSAISQGISTAIGSKKVGSPLYWVEVYCSGENMTGRWVHIDAVNAIIDGEQKVEAAAAACKTSLRYVVAFAGHGAKDVTRRYCMKWYKIASERVNSTWWDSVLAPLKELESRANLAGNFGLEVSNSNNCGKKTDLESSMKSRFVATRNTLEDMELETRALTEPLPTNQQAYKNHHLYAIERWLNKNQTLHPRGPVLGFCSGHPVYPRSCVQTLKTRERWLREGLQVKGNEIPAKVLKRASKMSKVEVSENMDKVEVSENMDIYGGKTEDTIELYGNWQLEPLRLPPAVNGIVPKMPFAVVLDAIIYSVIWFKDPNENERGQVDVWSEKCLPPGTVHLRLPHLAAVARRLEVDFAPAMVGFEFKNRRSYPVFDGIVVCTEFKAAILEAYAEQKERREAEERKRNEARALARWYQLLSSIVTRQRLKNSYSNKNFSPDSLAVGNRNKNKQREDIGRSEDCNQAHRCREEGTSASRIQAPSVVPVQEHEHVFVVEDQNLTKESFVLTKRCHCGFIIQVEEL